MNSTHFIYWGQTSYPADDGTPVYFQIIEQTEFCQDGSFNVFSSAQSYIKRAFATKNLPSASGKIAYHGPDHFGDIQKYPNAEKFPDKFQVDGFVLCVDASLSLSRSSPDVQKYFEKLIMEALQTKKPLVIAATKCDKMIPATMEKVQTLLASSKHKNSVSVVETSSLNNVNVETVFFSLAEAMGKVKFKTKNLLYAEAEKIVVNHKQQVTDDLNQLLNETITDCQLTSTEAVKVIDSQQAYSSCVTLHGSDKTKGLVRKHINRLRDAQVAKKKAEFLNSLPHYLEQLVPVVRSTVKLQDFIHSVRKFSQYFVVLDEGTDWTDTPLLTNPETIIPFQFLTSDPEAMKVLKEHLMKAQQQYRHEVAMKKIKNVMETSHLSPGKHYLISVVCVCVSVMKFHCTATVNILPQLLYTWLMICYIIIILQASHCRS